MTLQHQFDMVKQENELDYKVWSDTLKADIEEAKLTANGVISTRQLQAQTAIDIMKQRTERGTDGPDNQEGN